MNKRLAIAVSHAGDEPMVAEHFSGCDNFAVYEFGESDIILREENYFNPLAGQHTGSCQIPGYVSQFNIDVIIAGGMGRKAIDKFMDYGIEVITAGGLTCREALDLFVAGKLHGYNPCEHEHGHGNCHHH